MPPACVEAGGGEFTDERGDVARREAHGGENGAGGGGSRLVAGARRLVDRCDAGIEQDPCPGVFDQVPADGDRLADILLVPPARRCSRSAVGGSHRAGWPCLSSVRPPGCPAGPRRRNRAAEPRSPTMGVWRRSARSSSPSARSSRSGSLLVAVIWLHRPSRELAMPALRALPDIVRLARRLLSDPRTPVRHRIALVVLIVGS